MVVCPLAKALGHNTRAYGEAAVALGYDAEAQGRASLSTGVTTRSEAGGFLRTRTTGAQGERLVPPYTRGRVPLSLLRTCTDRL